MRRLERLIDANLNRAAEGLRCLEDVARFVLDDAALSTRAKHARHAVREAGAALLGVAAADRDSEADVGTTIKTDAELRRASLRDVIAAAAKRTQEALRVLEEAAKLRGLSVAAASLERARYEVYALEPALLARLGPIAPQWTLCVLITGSRCRRPWAEVARAAIDGGADCLQLREKSLADGELLERARRLVEIAAGRAAVIINDRPDIAALAAADGVHLGQTDLDAPSARRIVGDAAFVGVSTADLTQARAAAAAGASYAGLGPMFPSATKPKDALAGPAYLAAYLADPATRDLPHLAISGIDEHRAAELAALGCRGVAVSAAVCEAEDPRDAASRIVAAMRRGLSR